MPLRYSHIRAFVRATLLVSLRTSTQIHSGRSKESPDVFQFLATCLCHDYKCSKRRSAVAATLRMHAGCVSQYLDPRITGITDTHAYGYVR